jgi:predicted anti-sigma-YlaC factor YlaD
MTCQKAIDLLDAYSDESLRSGARWRVSLHLWCCRNCRRYLSSYRTTLRVEKRSFDETYDPAAAAPPEALVAAILAAARTG